MNLKRFGLVGLLAVFGFTGCHGVAPDAGHEAVIIRKPWFFGHGGVDPEPVKTGRKWVAISTSSCEVDVNPQQFEVEFDDLMTSDTVPLDFHGALRVEVTDSYRLVKDFSGCKFFDLGKGVVEPAWFYNNLRVKWASETRDSVKRHKHDDVLTHSIEDIDKEVKEALDAYIATTNLPVSLLGVTAGKANPPEAVAAQRIATATQQQRIQTEAQRKLAEDGRKAAEESRAAADNAYRDKMSLSTEQFVELERLKMLKETCGDKPGTCTFFLGGGPTPVLPVR
jgi:hypothetical protein